MLDSHAAPAYSDTDERRGEIRFVETPAMPQHYASCAFSVNIRIDFAAVLVRKRNRLLCGCDSCKQHRRQNAEECFTV